MQDARWTTAKANLARIKPLAEQNAVSKKDLDDAVGMELSFRSSVDAAKAAVDVAQANIVAAEAQVVGAQANIAAAEAQVLAAQAGVEKAQLNLGFTKITSPIEGIAGIAKAQIGNLVGPGYGGGVDDHFHDPPDQVLHFVERAGIYAPGGKKTGGRRRSRWS